MKNYYEILGIDESATTAEIKSAYHRLAKKYHPDQGGDHYQFKEISEAFKILGDKEQRKNYDEARQATNYSSHQNQQTPYTSTTEASSLHKRPTKKRNRLGTGVIITIIIFAVIIILGSQSNNTKTNQEQTSQLAVAGSQASMNLGTCLDNVDQWFNQNLSKQSYITQAEALLNSKTQQVNECQVRYPLPFGYANDPTGNNLQKCLDNADSFYNQNIKNQQYITQSTFLLEEKQQLVHECQVRWIK